MQLAEGRYGGKKVLIVPALLLLMAAGFWGLHLVHLHADFPNRSPWVDWAKYTDEGWYGDAAIRHYLRGTWRLPGDFNPAAALPVWPLLEGLVFRFAGVGIVAARALTVFVFAAVLVCSFLLLRHEAREGEPKHLRWIFTAAAVLLMATSPFLYVFTRMAILEPLLVLLMLLSLLAAQAIRSAPTERQRVVLAIVVGVLVSLMIGTKTTAVFLLPSIAYMLADAAMWQRRRILRMAAVTGGTVVVLWGGYVLWLVSHGYWNDFLYLFAANNTTIAGLPFWETVGNTLKNGVWMGSLLYPLAIALVVLAGFHKKTWCDPLFVSLLLWVSGYLFFLAYHANMQPRYYVVVAVPLTLLMARAALHVTAWHPSASLAFASLLVLLVGREAHLTLSYVRHPEYTYQTAADRIERIVESDPTHSHTVLSISGSDLSLMTGLPSICDDFGTMDLEDRIAAYKPGWFVSWNSIEDDKMEALSKFYLLTRVAEFPAMDDPDRNVMIVYRLDAKDGVTPQRKHKQEKALPVSPG
ncbi:ArnT family glycosyltransferase [Terriglobus sp. RCC_193]|uniref:ArnT family glycosyltransferase n=1 Tax=Terriglobus sp. RCC_193 TaxID=3239218 RepID=UPI003523D428